MLTEETRHFTLFGLLDISKSVFSEPCIFLNKVLNYGISYEALFLFFVNRYAPCLSSIRVRVFNLFLLFVLLTYGAEKSSCYTYSYFFKYVVRKSHTIFNKGLLLHREKFLCSPMIIYRQKQCVRRRRREPRATTQ